MPFIRYFQIAGPKGNGFLPFVNADGAFIGWDTELLEKNSQGSFTPISQRRLETVLSAGFGKRVDLGSCMNGLATVARALNQGDLALASIALVHLEFPPLPDQDSGLRMSKAVGMLDRGISEADVLKAILLDEDLTKYNHNHLGPGPGGGQFTGPGTANSGGGANAGTAQDAPAPPEVAVPLPPRRPEELQSVVDNVTVSDVSEMFPRTPVRNIEANLPRVLDALRAEGLVDKQMVLTALATIRAETAGFVPISEGISRYNTSAGGHPFDLYDNVKDLGNGDAPDGETFKGRGFVQLTGRINYKKYDRELGLGGFLVANPDLANDPDLAAVILAKYMKNHETRIRRALDEDDLAAARQAVNGGTHGMPGFTHAYRTGERIIN